MSAPFFAAMDVHQDLGQTSPGFDSEPVPISTYRDTEPVPISSYQETEAVPVNTYQEKDDFWENDFNVEATNGKEHPIPATKDDNNENGSSFTPGKTDLNQLPPIPPVSTGQGLPYAPVDWPNPGDVWTWRVGRRVSSSGFHHDRFLILPRRLQKRNVAKSYGSKQSLTRYIQTEFPNADVNAFFASFSWKIPALFQPAAKVDAASLFEEMPKETQEQAERAENAQKDGKESSSRYSQRKRKPMTMYMTELSEENPKSTPRTNPKSTPRTNPKRKKEKPTTALASAQHSSGQKSRHSSRRATRQQGGAVDLSFLSNEADTGKSVPSKKKKGTADIEDEQVSIPHIYVSPMNGVLAVSHSPVEVNPEEFDNYLNSLDNLLTQPPEESGQGSSLPVTVSSPMKEYELTEARIKLSSLLEKDFPSLFFSKDITELANLATKLRKDPSLSAEELVKLKLIEEIPSFSEVFRENKGVIEEAEKFFSALELNKAKVASLKYEYSELKDKLTNLHMEVDSNTEDIRQIDEQIAQLQARRAELTRLIGNRNKEKIDLNYAQKMVANSIPKVVQEVQQANLKKPEWEMKKENALKREAEILAKFTPLKGFYL